MGDDSTTGDMKAALTGGAKPPLAAIPRAALNYAARALQWGDRRYERGNYRRPPPPGVTPEARLLAYLDATMRHLTDVADALNKAIGTGGDVHQAAQRPDVESGLPELAHALASLSIGITCAVDDGLLHADPGAPWLTLRVQRFESSQVPLPSPVGSIPYATLDTVKPEPTPESREMPPGTYLLTPECGYAETRHGRVCSRCSIPLDETARGYQCRISRKIVADCV